MDQETSSGTDVTSEPVLADLLEFSICAPVLMHDHCKRDAPPVRDTLFTSGCSLWTWTMHQQAQT